MSNLDQYKLVAEMCGDFAYESSLLSMDGNEISCLSCTNWDGRRCVKNGFDKVISTLE